MPYFTFSQNNSGGSFDYDGVDGISHFVIVEENSAKEALIKASIIGLYFDGAGDCACCGNRWSDYVDDEDGTKEPEIASRPAAELPDTRFFTKWMKGYEVFVHHKDGRIEGLVA